jgi:hypothetical protein
MSAICAEIRTEIDFPYTQDMRVEVQCNDRNIDMGCIKRICQEGSQTAIKVVSHGFKPGQSRTFVLIPDSDPLGASWHEFYRNPLSEKHDEERGFCFKFVPLHG